MCALQFWARPLNLGKQTVWKFSIFEGVDLIENIMIYLFRKMSVTPSFIFIERQIRQRGIRPCWLANVLFALLIESRHSGCSECSSNKNLQQCCPLCNCAAVQPRFR